MCVSDGRVDANSKVIEFYWDIGSTNSYFAFHLLRKLAARYAARIQYIPFNLGYVFRHHNYVLADEPVAKLRNRRRDLMRWATRYDLPFHMPDQFPIKTSRVLRGSLAMRSMAGAEAEDAYLDAVFSRYWERNDESIAEYAGLASTVTAMGMNADEFVELADSSAIREQIAQYTDTALVDGIFGAPTMRIDGEIYWGKDRFEFIEDHLRS